MDAGTLYECSFAVAVCHNFKFVLQKEPQDSDEDAGETLKRTLRAQRQRRKKRVHLPLASVLMPLFFNCTQLSALTVKVLITAQFLAIYQLLERSAAQDDDVEEISNIQPHSEDEGSAGKAADPVVLSRPPPGSQRGWCPT